MGTVLVVGSFNVDHVWSVDALPAPGETRSGSYDAGPGGKGFNQAVACARSGAPTRFACALGDDAGGAMARSLAAADGIGLHAARGDQPTGTAGIFVDAGGRNSIVVAAGANASLDGEHVLAAMSAGEAPRVVLAQLETPEACARAAFEAARRSDATTVLNPAPANAPVPAALLTLVDILTPNETEFAALLARQASVRVDADALVDMADDALHALCRRLLPRGTVIITLGAAGCFVSHADGALRGDLDAAYRVPAPPAEAIDTTGAGDAFNGALCASIATTDRPFARHVRRAVAYASLSTERHGAAVAMPAAAELAARCPET